MKHQPSQRSRWRRWTERFAFAFVIVLWLGGSVVALAVKWPVGIAWFCVGALYVGGQLWIERHADQHPTLSIAWVAAWRTILGVVLIALGIIHLRWDSIFLFFFGTWFLLLAAVFIWLIWHDRKPDRPDASASG